MVKQCMKARRHCASVDSDIRLDVTEEEHAYTSLSIAHVDLVSDLQGYSLG